MRNKVKGLYYEDFNQGDEFISRGRTITEPDIVQFVNSAWYINPRCTDSEFVKLGYIWNGVELHERIAPPPLGTFYAAGLSSSLGILTDTLMSVLGATWRAPGAIAIGDTIHLRQRVKSRSETKHTDRGIVVFDMEVLNQKGDLVNNDQLTCLVARRQNLSQPITSFFATIEDPLEHWECPKKSLAERQQAKMESQYFEDFQVGQAFDTRARTVTETDVVSMVSLTWDHHPLYTDAEYARTTPFRERIAPPLLGIAFAVGLDAPLAMAAGTCLGFTQTDWRFRGPIKIGETISLEQTITACEAQDEHTGMVTIDMELVNQRGEVSISGTRYMVVRRKTALAQPATSGPRAWH